MVKKGKKIEGWPILYARVDPETLAAIEEFRWQHRFSSKARAANWLLRWALEQRPEPPPKGKRKS